MKNLRMDLKMDLQLFADSLDGKAVSGKKMIYLYRLLSEKASRDAALVAYVTENGRSVSNDAESTATKDGSIRTAGTPEIEITGTSILTKGDTMIDKLEDASLSDEVMEIWEVNLEEAGATAGKYKGTYYQGYLTSFEKSSAADGFVEISLTFGINGTGKRGDVTVTAAQQEMAGYEFADTKKTGA